MKADMASAVVEMVMTRMKQMRHSRIGVAEVPLKRFEAIGVFLGMPSGCSGLKKGLQVFIFRFLRGKINREKVWFWVQCPRKNDLGCSYERAIRAGECDAAFAKAGRREG
jgi:hypothetical protein